MRTYTQLLDWRLTASERIRIADYPTRYAAGKSLSNTVIRAANSYLDPVILLIGIDPSSAAPEPLHLTLDRYLRYRSGKKD